MPPALVSVIIPAYNAEAFLAATVRSVLAQDYPHFEVWIIDDGSTDRTWEIATEFAQQDSRIQVLTQKNAGVAAARNLGIDRSIGEFIAPLDADDLWEATALKKYIHGFELASERVGVLYTWSVDVDEKNQPTGGFHAAKISGRVLGTLLVHNFLGNASATMIRRSALLSIDGYDPTFRDRNAQGCEDWDLYFKLAECWEFGVVPEFLVRYRKPIHSMSQDDGQMARSHELVLTGLRDRTGRRFPNWMYTLSRSSLYVHFAHQAAQFGRDQQAKDWCRAAFKADRITPLLRPGWYRLRFGRSGIRETPKSLGQLPGKLTIGLKVWVSGILHFCLRPWQ